MELIQDLFLELSGNEEIAIPFQTRMFPVLVDALGLDKGATLVASALDLVTSLIRQVPDPLPSVYTTQIFPKVIHIMLTVDDSALLQNGQELLKVLVHRDFAGVSGWSYDGRSGLDYLLEFIGKMLRPEECESAAIFIGPLITKVVQKGGDLLGPCLPQLLTAIIKRLETAKMPAFSETLVMLFCNFIQKDTISVLNFLSDIQLTNGRNGLELLLCSWCESFPDVRGVYQVKLCSTAMMMVLSSGNPLLNSIMVKGDLIIQENQKILTRSMSKKSRWRF